MKIKKLFKLDKKKEEVLHDTSPVINLTENTIVVSVIIL
jgi:hypothetical protein